MKIKLSTKVALGTFLVAGLGVLLFAYLSYSQITQYFKENVVRHLSVDVQNNANDIENAIKLITHDVKQLASSEEMSGVLRATQNGYNYDALENMSLSDWKSRLKKEFETYLEQNKAYFQIRLIGVANGGKEIVRLDSKEGAISISPDNQLQKKGTRYYFKDTIKLKKNEVFISKIDLNKERGSIVFPIIPTIRVGVPIYDKKGKVFGIIIINAQIDKLFNIQRYKNAKNDNVYLTNSDGYYLFHKNVDKMFSFEFQKDFKIQQDFKADAIFNTDIDHLSIYGDNDIGFYAKKIPLGDSFIVLARSSTNIFLKEQSSEYEKKMYVYILAVTFMIAIFSTILTKMLTSPISKLTDRAKMLAETKGEEKVDFNDIKSNDEIGELAESMAYMVENLVKSKHELSQFASSLEQEVIKRTKEQEILLSIFDKGDAVLFKWNNDEHWSISSVSHSVQKLLGYSDKDFMSGSIVYAECLHKDDLPRVEKEVYDAIDSGGSFFEHKPYRLITKNGYVKWVHDYTIIVRDDDTNEITHFIGYLTDITDLKELNDQLEKKVASGVSELRQRDELLAEQSKLASMGEMIGAIAHQWRQPLNELSINIQNLDDDYEDGLIDEEFISRFIQDNNKVIAFMSNTIDDFRNFFRVDKTKELFSVREAIDQTLSIQGAQLKSHNIELNVTGDDFNVNGFKSEFQQVILNIINNSKDALLSNAVKDAKIDISLNGRTIIIEDNAGGIPSDILDRIFEPYFTTKEQGKGTGMGLYMSSMIIRDNMNGTIEVLNVDDGVRFTIGFENG